VRCVFLVGFMGSGKTVVGGVLAGLLGVRFVDLDTHICAEAGASVTELFERFGEAGFRAREAEALAEVAAGEAAVVATGGGAFCTEANREIVHGRGHASVFLDVPWEVIVRRLAGETADRPLFGDEATAARLYQTRLSAYRLAQVHVNLRGDEPPDQVARRIAAELEELECAI